jgi:hypothetical protein
MGEDQAILQLNSEPHAKELNLLLVSINVVAPVLCQVVELLGVLIDSVVPLVQIEKVYKLIAHSAR